MLKSSEQNNPHKILLNKVFVSLLQTYMRVFK